MTEDPRPITSKAAGSTLPIVASTTLCLALPKEGLIEGDAAAAVGGLLLADVGIPPYIYERLELPVAPNLFAEGPILRLISDA